MFLETQCVKYIKEQTIQVLNRCRIKNRFNLGNQEKELIIHVPSGDMKYKSFWIRDAAMMASSMLIGIEEIKGWLEIIAFLGQNGSMDIFLENGLAVPAWCVADHINFDAEAVYFPGTYNSGSNQGDGKFGYYPPHDNQYYFIDLAYQYYLLNGDLDFFNVEIKGVTLLNRLEYAFNSYNIDSDTQLCTSYLPSYTVDWGFCDQITKSGYLLFPSLLRYQAALRLSRIFSLVKDREKEQQYSKVAEHIKKSVITNFYNDSGWFVSATETCCQKDIWGTAFAVWLELLEEPYKNKTLEAIGKAFESGTSVFNGYVRHILEGEDASHLKTAWGKTFCIYNTYQNGGYWCTPSGWYIYALAQYNKELACEMLRQLMNYYQLNKDNGAPFEWINKDGKVDGRFYGASAALLYEAVLRLNNNA